MILEKNGLFWQGHIMQNERGHYYLQESTWQEANGEIYNLTQGLPKFISVPPPPYKNYRIRAGLVLKRKQEELEGDGYSKLVE